MCSLSWQYINILSIISKWYILYSFMMSPRCNIVNMKYVLLFVSIRGQMSRVYNDILVRKQSYTRVYTVRVCKYIPIYHTFPTLLIWSWTLKSLPCKKHGKVRRKVGSQAVSSSWSWFSPYLSLVRIPTCLFTPFVLCTPQPWRFQKCMGQCGVPGEWDNMGYRTSRCVWKHPQPCFWTFGHQTSSTTVLVFQRTRPPPCMTRSLVPRWPCGDLTPDWWIDG